MLSTRPIKLGLIGTGGRLRGVVRRLLREAPPDQIKVVAAFDPDPQSLQTLEDEHGPGVERMPSEEALVNHRDVDWIFIGSWNVFHARQAIAALQAGKNVFCEKPLATTLDDCLAVKAAVEKEKRIFSFGLVLRYSPHYRKIRELVQSGKLGRIISFEFNETLGFNHGGYIFGNWRRKTENAGSHVLEKCCHDIDLMNWITGDLPIRVASFGGRDFFTPAHQHHVGRIGLSPEGQPAYGSWADPARIDPFAGDTDILDNQVAILQYAQGARATFHTNCNAGIPERRLYLCGTEGALRADAITGLIEWQRIGHDTAIEHFSTGVAGGHAGGDEIMARGLVDTLLQSQPPLASVDEGIRSAVVAFAIDQATQEQRVVDVGPLWQAARIQI